MIFLSQTVSPINETGKAIRNENKYGIIDEVFLYDLYEKYKRKE